MKCSKEELRWYPFMSVFIHSVNHLVVRSWHSFSPVLHARLSVFT